MLSFLLSPFVRLFHVILGLGTSQSFPPPLDAIEEDAAFRQSRTHPDPVRREEARQKLILHNLRLVSHIVRKYYASSRDQEDLVSIGTIGLCKAVDTFRPETGTRFATYGAKCIQNEILMHFRARKKQGAEVSLSDTIDVDRDGNPLTYMDVISSEAFTLTASRIWLITSVPPTFPLLSNDVSPMLSVTFPVRFSTML